MKRYIVKEQTGFKSIGSAYLKSLEVTADGEEYIADTQMTEPLTRGTFISQTKEGNKVNVGGQMPSGGLAPFYVTEERKLASYYATMKDLEPADLTYLQHNVLLAHQEEIKLFPSYQKMNEFHEISDYVDNDEQVANFVNTTPFMGMDGVTRDGALLDNDLEKLATEMRYNYMDRVLDSIKELAPVNSVTTKDLIPTQFEASRQGFSIHPTGQRKLIRDANKERFSSFIRLRETDYDYVSFILNMNPNPDPNLFANAVLRLRNFDKTMKRLEHSSPSIFMSLGTNESGKNNIVLL
ncbi:MAG: hypothetical protein KAU20_06490 [Nanoarchaeota archaeon]|nr:hypothetical protein [Nanoarchaeota archaeon]